MDYPSLHSPLSSQQLTPHILTQKSVFSIYSSHFSFLSWPAPLPILLLRPVPHCFKLYSLLCWDSKSERKWINLNTWLVLFCCSAFYFLFSTSLWQSHYMYDLVVIFRLFRDAVILQVCGTVFPDLFVLWPLKTRQRLPGTPCYSLWQWAGKIKLCSKCLLYLKLYHLKDFFLEA